MERTRKIAASPVRPANETWTVIKTLLGRQPGAQSSRP